MKRRKILCALLSVILVLAIAGCILAACDKKTTATVTFEGEGIDTFKMNVKKGDTVAEPETPVRDGWLFGGWSDAEGNIWDFDLPVNENLTLHAAWGKANLVLDANGGTLGEGVQSEFNVKSDANYTLPVPTAPSEALTFAGWEADGAMLTGADGKSTAGWSSNGLVTASAVWVTKGSKDVFKVSALSDGTYSISAWGEEYSAELAFPSEIAGKAVTEIGDMSKLSATKVTVPASVKSIAAKAFARNASVTIVDMSNFGGAIGDLAFNVSAVEFVLLGGTTAIGEYAFLGSNIEMLYVPATVKSCAKGALENEALIEIDFEGDFPTLGEKVFGDGTSDLSIIASESAWNKLIEGTDDTKEFNVRVQEATGLLKGGLFTWSDEMMESGIASHGFYTGDEFDAYLGLGLNIAVIINGHVTLADVYDGKAASDHFYNYAATPTDTYCLDREAKTLQKLAANEKGEVIKDGVLYDYVGSESVYTVPDTVTEIAGGACMTASSLKFLHTGKNVTKIGSSAFANANLFGVTIGASVTEIGDYAFFLNSYLSQLIFEGTTAPTVGQGAFCDLIDGVLLVPMTDNTLASYGANVKIYTVDPVWGESAGKPFYEAMLGSLEGLDMSKVKDSPDAEEKPATYDTGDFEQLKSNYFAAKNKTYESDYGTITMFGTMSGYALIEYNEASDFKGTGYVYFNAVPGYAISYYDDVSVPLKFEMFYFSEGRAQSRVTYGKLGNDQLVPRGAEAGTYGDVDKDYFVLDGYSIIKCRKQDGQFYAGTYKNKDGELTVTGIEGILKLTFDANNKTLTFGGEALALIGEEAGVYYDMVSRAMLKLDGKPTEEGYSGTMTLLYKGETETMPYYINGKKLTFILNGVDHEWEFSKTSSDVCDGYYDEKNYEGHLTFNEISVSTKHTFTNGKSKLELDGFFGATLDGKDYSYYYYESGVLLFDGDDVTIYTIEGSTFTKATAAEVGMYYHSTSKNYRVYLDGKNALYFSGDEYDMFTYTLSPDGTFETFTVDGHQGTTLKGKLNTEKGYGMFVYYSWGDSVAAISKQPFEQLLSYESVRVYGVSDGIVKSEGPSFNAYVSNNVLFISEYGKPISMYELSGQAQNFTYTFTSSDGWTANIDVKVTKKEATDDKSGYEVEMSFKCASSDHKKGTLDGSEKQFVFSWLDDDKTKVGVYEDDSWMSNFFCGTVTWSEQGKSFTVTDGETTYTVSGYDTDNVTVTKSEPAKS